MDQKPLNNHLGRQSKVQNQDNTDDEYAALKIIDPLRVRYNTVQMHVYSHARTWQMYTFNPNFYTSVYTSKSAHTLPRKSTVCRWWTAVALRHEKTTVTPTA